MICKTLSHYKVIEKIGQGGMGEVYLAEDSRLDRKVALKILPQHLSERAELRVRFEREARAVSSLNHPRICTLHDIGEQDGIHFLVMEHVEGETLAARLERGALSLEQTLECAIQIADALDKAHRQGVVHRDLKPGNIMLTKSGAKLLDFGLAKLQAADAPSDLSSLPTKPADLTVEGTILGTLRYMAPEQLEGKEADSRTDIFAFGAVLYEMLTGKRAFTGKSQASLIGAIMNSEPLAISTLQPLTPAGLERAIKRCLAKDLDDRWQTARDLHEELRWLAEGGSVVRGSATAVPARRKGERLIWSVVVLVVAGVAAWSLMRGRPVSRGPVSRLDINVPDGRHLTDSSFSFAPPMALSPDGTRLVYSATSGDRPQLYLRHLDQFEAEPIDGTEGGTSPFFSPDSQWLGFFAGGKLQKVPPSGGAPQTICNVPAYLGYGVTWGGDGSIIYSASLGGLARVSAEGGSPETLTTPAFDKDEYLHFAPHILPDGKNVLFSNWGRNPGTALLSLESGKLSPLIPGAMSAVYLPATGHIVYSRSGSGGLFGVRFDLRQLQVTGSPIPILDGVHAISYSGLPSFAVSDTGSLVYEPIHVAERTLVWIDREGEMIPVTSEPAPYLSPSISPDDRSVLFLSQVSPSKGIWTYDFDRGTRTRLTAESSSVLIWATDGTRITFASRAATGLWNLSSKSADGSGDVQTLLSREGSQFPMAWSPDGQTLAYYDHGSTTGRDIWMLPLGGEPAPFLTTPYNEYMLRFSPDGRFVAYVSDESGQQEVYVQPRPGPGERITISTAGGREPVWSVDGRELFYRDGDQMMAVSLTTAETLIPGTPQPLFVGNYASDLLYDYDVSSDGQRFLMIQENEETTRPRFHVVLNWFEELERLVPTDKG